MSAAEGFPAPGGREMTAPEIDLDAETDRLYQTPLAQFVEARNALAARLKSAGDKEGAARVKALSRPSVSAWATNQVYWAARPEFDALLRSTESLQAAQAEGAAGAALREAMKARREALAAVMARVEALLGEAGHDASAGTLRKVFDTLEALAAENARPPGVRPGRLDHDLEPPGFEALAPAAGLPTAASRPAPAAPAPATMPAPVPGDDGRTTALEQARVALAETERALDQARRDARTAAGAQAVAEKRAEGARDELAEARRRVERAQERAAATADDESAARSEAARLAEARDGAEAARDAAERALRGLS